MFASGHPLWPHLLLAAARGTNVDDVVGVLSLQPGRVADVVGVSVPVPAPPLPVGERTVIPDEITVPMDDGPFATRRRLVSAALEPAAAASLAVMVPGRRGVALFMLARGDHRHDVAEMLGISAGEVDAILSDRDGDHLARCE